MSSKLDVIIRRMRIQAPQKGPVPFNIPDQESLAMRNVTSRRLPYSVQSFTWQKATFVSTLLGTFTLQRRLMNECSRKGSEIVECKADWNIRLHLNSWLGGQGVELSGQIRNKSWQYLLRPSYLRPSDAPIFCACGNRDISLVRHLLDSGLGSPFDVNEEGRTTLHVGHLTCQRLN